jgi:hypothetical protein
MKYLGITIDNKLMFREHITHATEKCRKIIFTLLKSAKLNWGLSHKALKTLYTGGIQPLLLYGAPVWEEILEKKSHREKLTRVQRLINIKVAKAYRTVSNDALCIITGLTPIHIKIKETAELYKIIRGNRHKNLPIEHDKLPKQWLHPAARFIATDNEEEGATPINIYTDGSKSERCRSRHSHNMSRKPNRKTDVQNGHRVHQQPDGSIRNSKGAGIHTNYADKRRRQSSNCAYG